MDNTNPLLQYSRRPEVYVELPSQGYFNDPDFLALSPNGEIGVAPMTTNDELLLKTPEGLLNGESLIKVVQSCCSGIKNVRHLPSPDLDVLLMAIRQASYGDEMELTTPCPECNHEGTYVYTISHALSNIRKLNPEYFIALSSGVTVFVRPYTVELALRDALKKFNESRTLQSMITDDIIDDPKKQAEVGKKIHALADDVLDMTAISIQKIVDPTGNDLVVTKDQIKSWLATIPRKDANLITSMIAEINQAVVDKKMKVQCQKCEHEWETRISFDPSSFFGNSS